MLHPEAVLLRPAHSIFWALYFQVVSPFLSILLIFGWLGGGGWCPFVSGEIFSFGEHILSYFFSGSGKKVTFAAGVYAEEGEERWSLKAY